MNIYLFNILAVLVGALFCATFQKVYININNKKCNIALCFFVIIMFCILFFEMAFRGDFSTDIKNYYYIFKSSCGNIVELFQNENLGVSRDISYQILNTVVHQFGGEFLHLQIIIALVISFFYVKFVKNNSPTLWLSFLILFCSGSFYTGFNVVRQLLVAALFSYCYKYIENSQFGKYVIYIILISTMHLSALFMLPMYFFFEIQWKKKSAFTVTGIVLLLTISAYLFANNIISVITKFVFTGYSDQTHYGLTDGVGLLGTLKAIAMSLGILVNYKRFDMSDSKERMVYNGTVLYLIFAIVGSKVFIIQRFTHFFIPCLMIGYPILLTKIKNKNTKQLMYCLTIGFFIVAGLNVVIDNNYYFYWDNQSLSW